MISPDDVTGEMRGLPFDELGADALLDGRVAEDDAPPGFQDVARLVRAASSPANADELVDQEVVVAVLAATVAATAGVGAAGVITDGTAGADVADRRTSDREEGGRRRMLTKILTAKVAAAAAVAVLGGGAAAAATGSLPASLQSSVSHGLSTLGIGVPGPTSTPGATGGPVGTLRTGSPDTTTGSATPSTTTTTTSSTTAPGSSTAPAQAVGPSASGPAHHGLCTAYAASRGSQAVEHSVAFRNLARAAVAKKESVTQFCSTTAPATTSGGTGSSTVTPAGPPIMPAVQGPPVTLPSGNGGTPAGNSPGARGGPTGQGHGSHGGGNGHGHSGGHGGG